MKIRNATFGIVFAALLSACGGGGDSASSPVTVAPPAVPVAATYQLSGQVQKGPFAIGSSVVANELDATLSPTGKVYSTQTSDDLGNFNITGSIGTNLVELVGDGFFMDELTGNLAGSRIQLRAIADLSVNTTPTINILTSMQAPRLKQLMAQGRNYAAANAQSQNEVLGAFGIDPATINGFTTLYAMKVNGSGDPDAVLLAASATLSKMAANAAVANSSSVSAELSNFINTIAAQLAAPGVVAPPTIFQAKALAVTQLDFTAIRRNVETYYAKRGVTMTAPKFEEWIDRSSAGTLPQRQVPVTGLTFTPVTGADAGQLVTSNPITVAGLGSGVTVPVSVSNGTTIIKNNVVSGTYAQVQNGDTVALRVLTAGYGYVSTSIVSIGASSGTWTVSSAALHGTITGLAANNFTLQNNGGSNITMVPGAKDFFFPVQIPNGTPYSVTIYTQPTGPRQVCSVSGGAGITGSGATNIAIICYPEGVKSLSIVSTGGAVVQHQQLASPLVVEMRDSIGNLVSGVFVKFSAVDGRGYITTQSNITVNGRASWTGYIHTVGQQIQASAPGYDPVIFSLNVVPTNHPYDGSYYCQAANFSPFSLVINNGLIVSEQSIIYSVYHMTGTINEATGAITAQWPAINGDGTLANTTDSINLSGTLQLDAFERSNAYGVANNPNNPATNGTSLNGNWVCNRL